MIKLSRRRLVQGLVAELRKHPAHAKQLIRQTAAYLIATRRTKELDLLLRDVAVEIAHVDGHLSADVQSAVKLDANARRAIEHLLQTATGAKTVDLHEAINPELIGGVVVRTPRHELDASIATKLSRLNEGAAQ